jgi:hypothetical protein
LVSNRFVTVPINETVSRIGGLYDATNFVKARPHIHVAMNYRLGPFGFFALDELFKESGTTGNYGWEHVLAAWFRFLTFIADCKIKEWLCNLFTTMLRRSEAT